MWSRLGRSPVFEGLKEMASKNVVPPLPICVPIYFPYKRVCWSHGVYKFGWSPPFWCKPGPMVWDPGRFFTRDSSFASAEQQCLLNPTVTYYLYIYNMYIRIYLYISIYNIQILGKALRIAMIYNDLEKALMLVSFCLKLQSHPIKALYHTALHRFQVLPVYHHIYHLEASCHCCAKLRREQIIEFRDLGHSNLESEQLDEPGAKDQCFWMCIMSL